MNCGGSTFHPNPPFTPGVETGPGNPSNSNSTPATVTSKWKLALGTSHSCAINDTGAVKCWGQNTYGQLGLGDTNNRGDEPNEMGSSLPQVNLGSGRTAITLGAGMAHTCAILDDHAVKCWGFNGQGGLGLGDTVNRGASAGQMGDNLPSVNLGSGRSAKSIAGGDYHTCAILDNDTVKCWGYNSRGQLGLGDSINRGNQPNQMGDNLPTVNLGTNRTAKAISAGSNTSCALLDNNTVKCWGSQQGLSENGGVLGVGNLLPYGTLPSQLGDALPSVDLGSGRTATAITSPLDHLCAILDDGSVKCWGDNYYRQLGLGDNTIHGNAAGQMGDNLPQVHFSKGQLALRITSGQGFSCAILADSTVECWGNYYLRGFNAPYTYEFQPAALGTGRTAQIIAGGGNHVCAILDNETVKCWGTNSHGQLGLGDTANRGQLPNQMGDNLSAVSIWP